MSALWPEIVRDDLPSLGLRFDVPVIFIQGTEDITTVTELAKNYFDQIEAPSKEFVSLEGAGHLAIFRMREVSISPTIYERNEGKPSAGVAST